MSCPPKFADLHKSTDDAFSTDYHQNCFNTKLNHNYSLGEMGNGKVTTKIDNLNGGSAPKIEVEFKHNMQQWMGLNMSGTTVTKTMTSGNDLVKIKYEKNLGAGKLAFKCNQHLYNPLNISKPDLSYDIGKDKFTANLNIVPKSNFMGLDSVSLATVASTGPANTGLKLAYNLAKGALSHELKISKNCPNMNLSVGVANLNDVNLVISKNLNKNVNLLGLANFNIGTVHSQSTYNMKAADWNSNLCMEWNNGKVGNLELAKGKCKLDLKNLAYHESATINVNNNLGVTFGFGSTMNANLFDDAKLGVGLNFNL